MKRTATLSVVTLLILSGLFVYSRCELICFFDPWIDTQVSPGFSDAAFQKIRIGMSQDEVVTLLGQPLSKISKKRSGCIEWWFTRDGKCKWGDFAWMARSVMLSNQTVVEIHSMTHYD